MSLLIGYVMKPSTIRYDSVCFIRSSFIEHRSNHVDVCVWRCGRSACDTIESFRSARVSSKTDLSTSIYPLRLMLSRTVNIHRIPCNANAYDEVDSIEPQSDLFASLLMYMNITNSCPPVAGGGIHIFMLTLHT